MDTSLAPDRMAEFNAILTASFDQIGSNVPALDSPYRLVSVHASESPRLESPDKATRRCPFSFLRKVKSHAASLLTSHTRLDLAPPSPHSFVPPLPVPPRAPTPIPFASSLPRNVLARAQGKHLQTPDSPDFRPQRSFFDDDDDEDDNVDRRVCAPTRRISSAPARTSSRLSSAFVAAPILFGLSSHTVSTPHLIPENTDVVTPEFRPALAHQSSKSSLRLRLRTKFSLPKLASPRSHLSSPSTCPSPVTPSYHSHPYSSVFSDFDHTHPRHELLEVRSITPEDDPFRKDELVHPLLANSRLPCYSPRSSCLGSDNETDKEILGSRSLPMPSSRWSSDSESASSSHNHTPFASGRPGPVPSAAVACPSSSLSFPLPLSASKRVPLAGVIARVSTPSPGPPPAYPPPITPPPCTPLPCAPPAITTIPSPSRPSARQAQRRRSHLQMDKRQAMPALQPLEYRPDAIKSSQQKSARRRRDRPVTPFPLLLPAGRVGQEQTGRLEASRVAASSAGRCKDLPFDQRADAIADSEVEPDRGFASDKVRKKMSVSSATSARTIASGISTTSVSTATSSTSVVTASTAATTVSPSTSPHMSADKPHHVSQVLVTDEEGRIVSTATYSTPSSWPAPPPPTNANARSSGIYIEQGGAAHEASSDLFLVRSEHVVISASSWTEVCDPCRDVSLCLAGSHDGNGVVDVLVVEIHCAGKMCSFELRIDARAPSPRSSDDDFPGRIPGSYPPSSDTPSLPPIIPGISPIDIPQSGRRRWRGCALGLEGVPSLHEVCPARSGPGRRPDCTHEGESRRRTVGAFTATLPTTLRDLAKKAREMSAEPS